MTVVQSVIARAGFIALSRVIHFESLTNKMKIVVVSVSLIFFLNYGLLYLIGPIKFNVTGKYGFGYYSDFNHSWFDTVGVLIFNAMLINAIWPIIAVLITTLVSKLTVFCDRRDSCKQLRCRRRIEQAAEQKEGSGNTKSKSLYAYQEKHIGPEFEIHYHYAQMLVIAWVTFLFAPGIPLLFPLALLGMIILYVTNRLQLAYQCRAPPVYDNSINTFTVSLLNPAPLLYAGFGAWLYSNQQAFFDKYSEQVTSELFMPSQHSFKQFFTQLTPGSVFFFYIGLLVVLLASFLWQIKVRKNFSCCKKRGAVEDKDQEKVRRSGLCCLNFRLSQVNDL